ncbi:MAG: cbb3-type cytochrome c oxidase subunit I [Desulfobacteraceae bacterium]|jgi:cytochrome c oxidase cbb3-type subunit 1
MISNENNGLVNYALVKFHLAWAVLYLLIVLTLGVVYSLQLLNLNPLPEWFWLSPGRLRMVHTNGAVYGFITNGFTAGLYWAIPRLCGYRVFNEKYVGWFLAIALQVAVLGTVVLIMFFGMAQAIEWGETPAVLDPIITAWLVVWAIQFIPPIFKAGRDRPLFAANWYLIIGLVWVIMVYFMGNFIPEYFVPGVAGAAVTGTWIHDAVGLYVTPIGWGLMYYFVPVLLRKPIWSHALSLLGFWGLAFFYPLQGVHHYLWSPIPMYAQYAAVICTVVLELAVITVIVNFLMTLRGDADKLKSSIPLRWMYVGTINYAITCLQCAFHVLLTTQKVIHFTDWVPGHAHLIMYGTFGFWLLGFFSYLWPKVFGKESYSKKLEEFAFWSVAIGMAVMWGDLLAAGLVEGFNWWGMTHFMDVVRSAVPFWAIRTLTGVSIWSGIVCFAINMILTVYKGKGLIGTSKLQHAGGAA